MTFSHQRSARVVCLSFLSCLIISDVARADPALRIVKGDTAGTELVKDGGFENAAEGKLRDWTSGPKGFVLAAGEGRNGSHALRCENDNGEGWYGASQTIVLNHSNVVPLVVQGWSKAVNVSGSSDNDYSLYVDVLYRDGTPLWGQTANFRPGTHDWERRELVVLPEQPVKSLTLHCLFRNHSGQVWFDDVSVTETQTEGAAVLFQGVAVMPEQKRAADRLGPRRLGQPVATADGLRLAAGDGTVESLEVGGKELRADVPSGFLARDVAANSDIFGFEGGDCSDLGLKLKVQFSAQTNHIKVEGRLSDTRGRDRAVTLIFALPLDASGWRWGDDIRHSRRIEGQGEFSKMVSIKCGATGTMSLYPLAALWNEQQGLALGIDMARPAQYRIGYHAGTKQLFIAYDFGLVQDTEGFPASAEFRFVVYRFEARWGFRAAFQKLMSIYPDYFHVRSNDQGIWMPFTDIATVQGWEDFGFKYHEGNNNVAWDDAHGVLSFRYTEPMTWWMRMSKETPRTVNEAVRQRNELALGATGSESQMARVSQAASMGDESGQPCLLFRNEPWCNGAVWSLNPNPQLPAEEQSTSSRGASAQPPRNAATVHWNESLQEELYGTRAKGRLDGEYLDSLEGYVTADLNFRREHFRYTTVPLTFASETKQPALFKGLAVFEFTRWFCKQVHSLGKLTFANGVPYRFSYLCPWLDVLGTETDWVRAGKYQPASDEQMSFWRTMSGAKPYLLLMNTDYDIFTPEMVERYFQRSLFYGMFPGMFSHNAADNPYWRNPKWYNRDRLLFKRYVPLVRRVSQAGWQPVTDAACDNPHIFVERFGPDKTRATFLTLLNDTDSQQSGRLHIDFAALGLTGAATARELISGQPVVGTVAWAIKLEPQEAQVLEVIPGR